MDIFATSFNIITGALLAVLGVIEFSKRKKDDQFRKRLLLGCLAVSIALGLIFQVAASVHQHKYKSDLVLRFEDRYEDRLPHERVLAAMALQDYLAARNWNAVTNEERLDNLEDVLGFFDELGFYWKNAEISSDVLYEHFYDDLRMYGQESVAYVRREQGKDSTADWEYVNMMLTALTEIEAQKTHRTVEQCVWTTNYLKEALASEIRLQSAKHQ